MTTTILPKESPTMAATVRYCRGCNEQFSSEDDDPHCPHCRQLMTDGEIAPTMELAETAFYDASAAVQQPKVDLRRVLEGRTFDSYTIDSLIGKGGMAWVFHARHNYLERPCAIKILSPELRERSQDFLDLFIAEARAAASVVHPNIVTVHNIGETGSYHYIELEFVAGKSLQSILRQDGSLPPVRATSLLTQSCSALAEAHRSGLIHRDFKPSNILVTETDSAKLADFGLAKRIAADPEASAAPLAGTPYYMAPELFDGRPADQRSDVYAVGISLYCLLTGRFTFLEHKLSKLIQMHRELPPPDPRQLKPELPLGLVQLMERCLDKRPERRPEDGAQLYRELRQEYLQLRDIRALVKEAVEGLDLQAHQDGQRLVVDVPLAGGRRQRVYIEDRLSGPWDEELVKIYSLCCPVSEDHFRYALELNANIAHGSLAIEEVDGQPFFVMSNRYPRATCDVQEIRTSVLDISKWADEVEHLLTGDDVY